MKNRANGIDFIKLSFAFVIAFGHFGTPFFDSGIVVCCFFILSGCFLVQSYNSGKYSSSFEHIKIRIQKIYPHYIFSLLILLSVCLLSNFINNKSSEDILSKLLPELFLVQNIGWYNGGINYPLWQISSLYVASYILFGLLSYNDKLTQNVICPIISIVGYTYYFNAFGTHNVDMWGAIWGVIPSTLFRAFSGLSLGVSLYVFIKKASKWFEERGYFINICFSVISVIAFVCLQNSVSIIAFVIMCICAFSSKSLFSILFDHKVFSYCEKLSLSIYLNQVLVIRLMGTKIVQDIPINKNILFLILLLGISVIFEQIISHGLRLYCRIKQKPKILSKKEA